MKSETKKFLIGALVIAAFTVPIFRSGGRTGLSFVGWIINHTIFGPPIEYVPEEDYARELEGVTIIREITPISSTKQAMAFYQISEESAKELYDNEP